MNSKVLLVSDGYRMRNEELGASGVPFVRGGDIGDGWIDTNTVDHIRPEFIDRLRAKLSRAGDTAFITKGTVGRAGYLREGQPQVTFAPQVAYWRSLDHSKLAPRFIYYLIRSPAFHAALDADKSHGAMVADYVSLSQQHDFRFLFPPIAEQNAIASLLGALDDKIDLNRRTNETLEAMARAIFKDWFVDFGPTRAKMEGRSPHHAPNIWSVFPDRLESDERPRGWRKSEIGEIANVIDCLHSKKPNRLQSGKPLLQLSNLRDDGLLDMSDIYNISEEDYSHWTSRIEASPGDCVITNVGRVGAVAQVPFGITAALGRNMTGVRCREEFPFPTFLIECLTSSDMKVEIERRTDAGTILSALNVRSIPKLQFVLPTEDAVIVFEKTVRPIRQRMEENLQSNMTLATLRNLLLPKLMSGEVRLKDAEKIAEAAE